jgi:hypothetical protein
MFATFNCPSITFVNQAVLLVAKTLRSCGVVIYGGQDVTAVATVWDVRLMVDMLAYLL